MSRIEKTILVESQKAEDYREELNRVIDELQSLNLEVEVLPSMCQAQKGVGYMYSAVVVGRR